MTDDPPPELPATYRRLFQPLSRVPPIVEPLPPFPGEGKGADLPSCKKCTQKVAKRDTVFGYLWVNSLGHGQCRRGGLHEPPP